MNSVFFYDGKMLTVGDFNKILTLNDNEIGFDFKRYVLVVEGEKLVMPYLEDKEVGVKGIVKHINIKYKMVKDNV